MKTNLIRTVILLICLGLISASPSLPAQADTQNNFLYLPMVRRLLGTPVLKWQRGGCYSSWCETGWYSSPAVADIGGGKKEVIASAYSVWALDGETGALLWRSGNTNNRTWPGVVLADIDKDGVNEIVVAQSSSRVMAYKLDGGNKWANPTVVDSGNGEFRGLLAADLDGTNGPMEIVATRGYGSGTNTWVLNSAGALLGGKWPQMRDGSGYAWGVYNANAAAGDLRPDLPGLELVVPSDVHYINAYDKSGNSLAANTVDYPGKAWGKVGMWEDPTFEKTGGDQCNLTDGRNARYRANFADGPSAIADLNGDGIREVVAVGNMQDCAYDPYASRYAALFILNADRSRFNTGGYDWRTIPVDTGAPLSEDYNVIESYQANPVVADLDGDGKMEILYSSYDGRVHAFWLDKKEHGSWPYSVYQASEEIFRFASEPLVADLDNDGYAEVIFTSWTQIGSNRSGKLHIVSAFGQPISEVDLPAGVGTDWNGAMAAPTLANIDSDSDLEVVVNTANSGVVAYDLPGSAGARVLWGTGRGSYTRTASR